MILLIDNYDSFVHNLGRYFERLGCPIETRRNDALSLDEIASLQPDAIVISPGPCGPAQAGICLDLLRQFAGRIPMLGVCLGHQAIAAAFGGKIIHARRPVHGQTSLIRHDGGGVFRGLPNPFAGCRYHSLVVERESLPACFQINAETVEDGTIMGLTHKDFPLVGVQFHPESILTEHGYQLVANFLELSGIGCAAAVPDSRAEEGG
jgi:anthranilate synthase component 2